MQAHETVEPAVLAHSVAIALPGRRSSYDSIVTDFSDFMVGTNATMIEPEQSRVVIYAANPLRFGATFEQLDMIALSTYTHSRRALSRVVTASDLLAWEDITPRAASIADVDTPPRPEVHAGAATADDEPSRGRAAQLAADVRMLSGLSTEKIGALFPVERETYQRWLSGRMEPSEANLERLLLLHSFFSAARGRSESPDHWLLTPVEAPGSSPYDALARADLSRAWELLRNLPAPAEEKPSLQLSDGSKASRARATPTGTLSTISSSEPPPAFDFFDDEDDED